MPDAMQNTCSVQNASRGISNWETWTNEPLLLGNISVGHWNIKNSASLMIYQTFSDVITYAGIEVKPS